MVLEVVGFPAGFRLGRGWCCSYIPPTVLGVWYIWYGMYCAEYVRYCMSWTRMYVLGWVFLRAFVHPGLWVVTYIQYIYDLCADANKVQIKYRVYKVLRTIQH